MGGTEILTRFARKVGFHPEACTACGSEVRPECPNCRGTGRLWSSGAGSLNDEGLERLRGWSQATPRGVGEMRRASALRLTIAGEDPALASLRGSSQGRSRLA